MPEERRVPSLFCADLLFVLGIAAACLAAGADVLFAVALAFAVAYAASQATWTLARRRGL